MAQALRRLAGDGPDAAADRRRGTWIALIPSLTLICFLSPIVVGLTGTLLPAFGVMPALGADTPTLAPWSDLFAAPGLGQALLVTLWSGIGSALISLAITVAILAAWHDRAWFRRLRRLLSPLLATPHAGLAIGLAFVLAPAGWLVRLVSPWGTGWDRPPDLLIVNDPYAIALVVGLVLKETPFLLLMGFAAVQHVRPGPGLQVARSAGYGPVAAWIRIVFPRVYPLIRLPIYAVLAFSLSVVDMSLILGPSTPPTLAVMVLRWFNDPDLTMRLMASAGACLQIMVVAGAIAGWRLSEIAIARLARPILSDGRRGGGGAVARFGSAVPAIIALALAGLALASLALWSVADRWRYPAALPTAWALDTWTRALPGLARPAWTTLITGLAATGIALVLVIGCLEYERRAGVRPNNRVLWLLYTPLLVPQIGFLFGVQTALVATRLDGGWIGLIWSHLLFVLPYVFLALADPWRALDDRYARSAACLGASPNRVLFRVILPMLLRPVLVAAAIGFSVSVAQYLPTVFAGAGRLTTLTTEAVGLSGGADRRVLAVTAFTQTALPLLVFAVALAIPAIRFRHRQGLRA